MNTQELFEQIQSKFEEFSAEHVKSSKSAHSRARKLLGNIKKLISEYRKVSIAEDKVK